MIATFYSYKGGVGRTLALANVAYLLASDEENPCRVLLWDFDLEAPGLQHVFKCKMPRGSRGFVDCVHEYLRSASLPDVRDFIHPTDVPGVDLLPAGRIDHSYPHKLESIRWRQIYDQYRGYDFISELRRQLVSLRAESGAPRYDYILIDARTGYSDVGGICVQQLPDVVVLMFRLNRQNIEGIGQVHKAIQACQPLSSGRTIGVVPVMSPAWPFATRDSAEPVARAKRVFDGLEVLTVTFEAALTFGERIIAREQADYPGPLRVCEDYQRIANQLVGMNADDARTMEREAEQLRLRRDLRGALEAYQRLLQRRPDRSQYWVRWQQLAVNYVRSGQSAADGADTLDFEAFVDQWRQSYPGDVQALLARARYYADVDKTDLARVDYEVACQLADDSRRVEVELAAFLAKQSLWQEAEACLVAVLDSDASYVPALVEMARLQQRRGDTAEALSTYDRAVRGGFPPTATMLRLAFRSEQFEMVVDWAERIPRLSPEWGTGVLLRLHALAALASEAQVRSELSALESAASAVPAKIIELLIVLGDHDEARRRLDAEAAGNNADPEVRMLRAVLAGLEGHPDVGGAGVRALLAAGGVPQRWSYDELRAYLKRLMSRGGDRRGLEQIAQWLDELERSRRRPRF